MATKYDQEQADWWKEDADRYNRMGQLAQEMGIQVDGQEGPSPPLNPDGSLKQQVGQEPIDNQWRPL